jgi:hypothetical protein
MTALPLDLCGNRDPGGVVCVRGGVATPGAHAFVQEAFEEGGVLVVPLPVPYALRPTPYDLDRDRTWIVQAGFPGVDTWWVTCAYVCTGT